MPEDLLRSLQLLDRRLARAAESVPAVFGPDAPANRFRGLHISGGEVARLLEREPLVPAFGNGLPHAPSSAASAPLHWLAEFHELDDFDSDVVVLALAPDLDTRYERVYAYLQDDATRRRPSIDLSLNLFCASAAERLRRRAAFAADSPLIRRRILRLEEGPDTPFLQRALRVDEQIVNALLCHDVMDSRIAHCCRILRADVPLTQLALPPDVEHALPAMIRSARLQRLPLRVAFHGPPHSGRRRAAAAVAAVVDTELLVLDVAQLLESAGDAAEGFAVACRAAQLRDSLLLVHNTEALERGQRPLASAFLTEALNAFPGIAIVAGGLAWPWNGDGPNGVVGVRFAMPPTATRRRVWRNALTRAEITVSDTTIETLARCFHLLPSRIEAAVAAAATQARWSAAAAGKRGATAIDESGLFAAARSQSGQELASLAVRVESAHRWDDLVLPDDSLAQLNEMCERIVQRERVLESWGFGAKLTRGSACNALFSGPSGTGKTTAAECIANSVGGLGGVDLYRVELAGVVSKYIGETEKNLDRIFTAAESANAIILFDEADAIFGKRSAIHDAHDRYANLEISYLLQKMEQFTGPATILATNMRANLDEALVRRLAFAVHFPLPDERSRRRIWEKIFPPETPLARDIHFDVLAARFPLSGGNIKNVAVAAAFLGASAGDVVTMRHVLEAVRREYQKVGKTLSAAELSGAAIVR